MSALIRAAWLMRINSSTWAGVAGVVASTAFNCASLTKSTRPTLSRLNCGGRVERSRLDESAPVSSVTATTPANAAPNAEETLFTTPRSAPTSPAYSFGDAETRTLKSSVSMVPSPIPASTNPMITRSVPQSWLIVRATSAKPIAFRMKQPAPIKRGFMRP